MVQHIVFTITALLISSSASAAGVVARAETTDLQRTNGTVVPRVVRDKDGHVTRLLLNDMKLSPEDVAELGSLEHLRGLVLFRTNFTDGDLAHLKRCKRLEHLNLTSTEVSDDAIDTILKLERLKSLCLGDVNITPNAIEKLKERNRTRDRKRNQYLRWGHSQRKKRPADGEQSDERER
jgi:hypothetical protein